MNGPDGLRFIYVLECTDRITYGGRIASRHHIISGRAEVTDSQYVQRGMAEFLPRWRQNGWSKSNRDPVLNREMWEQLDSLTQPHQVTWTWVRGHSGHPDQERCDRLATSAAYQFAERSSHAR